jgi:hypothetical protein
MANDDGLGWRHSIHFYVLKIPLLGITPSHGALDRLASVKEEMDVPEDLGIPKVSTECSF